MTPEITQRSDGTPLVAIGDGKAVDAATLRNGIAVMGRTLFEGRNAAKALRGREFAKACAANALLSAKLKRYEMALSKIEQE